MATGRRWLHVAMLLALGACEPEPRAQRPPPPPPCYPDGVYRAAAQRTQSSGSVCNLRDLAQLQGDVTVRRTGPTSVQVDHAGQYAHGANLDPVTCTLWTPRSPSYGRTVLGTKVSGTASYRVALRPDGQLQGQLQLDVQSNNFLVPGCQATFNLWGQRVR